MKMVYKSMNKEMVVDGKKRKNKEKENDEDDLWHEVQLTRKMILIKKIDEYVESFTVHGLTKVFRGNRAESMFWLMMLFGGILLSFTVIHGLVTKLLRRGVYTEIKSQVTDFNYFPSVTFCESQRLRAFYFTYCGYPPMLHPAPNTTCSYKLGNMSWTEIEDAGSYWSNGLFNVTSCLTWGGKSCVSSKYFKSLSHFNHSCITWNYQGNLHDIYSHSEIAFHFIKPREMKGTPSIIAVPHHPEIHEIDITATVNLAQNKYYEIKLDKTLVRRLPAPFPSNCTMGKDGDIFPGRYTRSSCIESHNYIGMYKMCGDTIDYVRPYIPQHIKARYYRNRTVEETVSCIMKYSSTEAKRSKYCQFPCEDLDLGVVSSYHENHAYKMKRPSENSHFHVAIQYQRVDTYRIMEEKALYTWDQMACEIGGFIGLVIGASILSFIEVCAYVTLITVKQFL